MSRARRKKHAQDVWWQKNQRDLSRRGQWCRQIHWRRLLDGMKLDSFRRPMNIDARQSWLYVRCPQHRFPMLQMDITITRKEEREVHTENGLFCLIELKLRRAVREMVCKLAPRWARLAQLERFDGRVEAMVRASR